MQVTVVTIINTNSNNVGYSHEAVLTARHDVKGSKRLKPEGWGQFRLDVASWCDASQVKEECRHLQHSRLREQKSQPGTSGWRRAVCPNGPRRLCLMLHYSGMGMATLPSIWEHLQLCWYSGNIIITVLYCHHVTSSMGTVNKNSSYSPVWVCVLCFFRLHDLSVYFLYILFYLGLLVISLHVLALA